MQRVNIFVNTVDVRHDTLLRVFCNPSYVSCKYANLPGEGLECFQSIVGLLLFGDQNLILPCKLRSDSVYPSLGILAYLPKAAQL